MNESYSNQSNLQNISFGDEFSETNEHNWIILALLPLVILVAVGNLFVIAAVYMEKKLQSDTNYFLTSLAVADLLVAITVMPPSMTMIFFNNNWPFSNKACAVWLMLDVFFSTSSILHLCTLSLNRYMALSRPFHTRHQSTVSVKYYNGSCKYSPDANNSNRKMIFIKICGVWLAALAISAPIPVLGLHDPENIIKNGVCSIYNQYFAIFGSVVAFFLPLCVMIVVHSLTIRILHQQITIVSSMMNTMRESRFSYNKALRVSTVSSSNNHKQLLLNSNKHDSINQNNLEKSEQVENYVQFEEENVEAQKRNPYFSFMKLLVKSKLIFRSKPKYGRRKRKKIDKKISIGKRKAIVSIRNEQRALKALGLIFTLFCVFWCPFFLTNFITRLCRSCNLELMYKLLDWFVWVGYLSSGINPLVYTMFSRQFRRTFVRMLTCSNDKQTEIINNKTTIH